MVGKDILDREMESTKAQWEGITVHLPSAARLGSVCAQQGRMGLWDGWEGKAVPALPV
jgi:hypothetical protein